MEQDELLSEIQALIADLKERGASEGDRAQLTDSGVGLMADEAE
jgi:hypothetical protein